MRKYRKTSLTQEDRNTINKQCDILEEMIINATEQDFKTPDNIEYKRARLIEAVNALRS